jgi:hypothetical protein
VNAYELGVSFAARRGGHFHCRTRWTRPSIALVFSRNDPDLVGGAIVIAGRGLNLIDKQEGLFRHAFSDGE